MIIFVNIYNFEQPNHTMIKRYFNADAVETGAAPSVAELMAKQGKMSSSDTTVYKPIVFDNTEKKEEPTNPAEDSPAVTATEPSNGEKANLETPSPEVVETKVEEPQKEEQPQNQVSWQEVLRNQQPDIVLKELGFDDNAVGFLKEYNSLDPKMKAFLEVWKSGGDVKDYLMEMTTDYGKLSAEEVMRHQLRREYPKASQAQLDALYKREVVRAYSLDSDDEDELREGQALLEAKADKYREQLIKEQESKLLPSPPQKPDNSEAEAKAEAERLKQFEDYKQSVTGHEFFKNIAANKSFSFGDGDEKFNFPVDPNAIQEVLFTDKWQENMFDKAGKPNVEHQLLVATVNKYGVNFLKELAKHFKSIGGQKAIEPIDNAKKPDIGTPSASEAAPKSPAEAMARFGRLS